MVLLRERKEIDHDGRTEGTDVSCDDAHDSSYGAARALRRTDGRIY